MNTYEYESTLDCRDAGGGHGHGHVQAHGHGHGGVGPGTLPMSGRPSAASASNSVHSSQTLQHQNQQNLQAAQAAAAAQSSHYDYEYQHLPHRPPDTANNTAQRTHGRQGFLLEGVTPTAPPDVPPRNPTMSRLQNGRLTVTNPNDVDFEPSCLVRTPSGNVYIPSGNLNINKASPIDFKSGSACSTPTKETLKSGYDRGTQGCMGPVLPPRSVMNGLPSHHYSAPMNFRKDLAARCSSPWVSVAAISALFLGVLMLILLTTFGGLHWTQSAPCTVLVGNEASEVTAAKSTNTDLSKLHNSATRSKNGQAIGPVPGQYGSGGGLGSSTATVTAATSNSGTAQGLQSTSASAEASSSAATTSSQSSLTPSTSLSSSLANANNGGRETLTRLSADGVDEKVRRNRRSADKAENGGELSIDETFGNLITIESLNWEQTATYFATTPPRKLQEVERRSSSDETSSGLNGVLSIQGDEDVEDETTDYVYEDEPAPDTSPATQRPRTRQQFGKSLNSNLRSAAKTLVNKKTKYDGEAGKHIKELEAFIEAGMTLESTSTTDTATRATTTTEPGTSTFVAVIDDDNQSDSSSSGAVPPVLTVLRSDTDDIVEINTALPEPAEGSIPASSPQSSMANDFQIKGKAVSESGQGKPATDDNNNERDLADNYELRPEEPAASATPLQGINQVLASGIER